MAGKVKYALEIKPCGTIRDLQKREDLTLVTDSQDVQAVKDQLGNSDALDDFDGFFVNVGEGEYTEVYGFQGNVPFLGKSLYCVSNVWRKNGKEIRRDQVCKCPEM
jgi:hypothetical protein